MASVRLSNIVETNRLRRLMRVGPGSAQLKVAGAIIKTIVRGLLGFGYINRQNIALIHRFSKQTIFTPAELVSRSRPPRPSLTAHQNNVHTPQRTGTRCRSWEGGRLVMLRGPST